MASYATHHRAAGPHRQRPAYRSTIHTAACRTLGIRHLRTRAYRPQTNGKAERFIRTLLTGWACGAIYRSGSERTATLDGDGSTTTTITANAQPSATNRPSLASTSGTTLAGLTPRPTGGVS